MCGNSATQAARQGNPSSRSSEANREEGHEAKHVHEPQLQRGLGSVGRGQGTEMGWAVTEAVAKNLTSRNSMCKGPGAAAMRDGGTPSAAGQQRYRQRRT